MIKIVFLFKLPNIFREDSEVIGIVFFLRSIKSELVGHRGLAVNANVEKHRNNVKFHILKHITVTSRDSKSSENIELLSYMDSESEPVFMILKVV